jgi:hypothetical protein
VLSSPCPLTRLAPAKQDVLVHQKFINIFVVIVAAILMHAVYLAFNFVATW